MTLIFSYSCNLRANLITPEFEQPIRTHEDVVNRGKKVYIPQTTVLARQVPVVDTTLAVPYVVITKPARLILSSLLG